ncbi:mechanosensitive ion channel [Flavobacteriales bacterium]|nr:mechanosensitive ion channel [Flavobacteriales bacterium]
MTTTNMNEFLSISMTLGHHTITVLDLVEVVVVVILSRIILGLLRRALRRAERFSTLDEGKRFIVHRMVSSVVWTLATLTVLSVLGLDLTAVWAGSAALMVGVGIGLQGFFNDVISGFVLMFEGGVAVGNVIEVDGKLVRVERIDLRSTRVVSTDGELLVLPNAKVAGDAVINMSQGEASTRIKVNVGVAYGSDVDLVQQLLLEAMSVQPELLSAPEPKVFFQDFGDSSLDFSVMGWVKHPWDRMAIQSRIRASIDAKFRAHGIQIPFPQRDVHMVPSGPQEVA